MRLQLFHPRVILPLLLVFISAGQINALPAETAQNDLSSRGLISDLLKLVGNVLSMDPLGDIMTGLDSNPSISNSFPGLRNTIAKLKNKAITPEAYVRALLIAIQQHESFIKGFGELDEGMQENVRRFMAGEATTGVMEKRSEFFLPPSPAVKEHFRRMEEGASGSGIAARAWLNAKRQTSPAIYENEGRTKAMKVSRMSIVF